MAVLQVESTDRGTIVRLHGELEVARMYVTSEPAESDGCILRSMTRVRRPRRWCWRSSSTPRRWLICRSSTDVGRDHPSR